jgi:uncharacterized membrane protein YedE/YeeE
VKNSIALVCGIIFGTGLAVSGMTNTYRVLGFLDVFGTWDPALAFVMGAAVLTTLIGFRWVLGKGSPIFAGQFYLPTASMIDKKLLGGALLFGIGWGLYGYCPGPAISALVYLQPDIFGFVAAMAAGMFVHKAVAHLMR